MASSKQTKKQRKIPKEQGKIKIPKPRKGFPCETAEWITHQIHPDDVKGFGCKPDEAFRDLLRKIRLKIIADRRKAGELCSDGRCPKPKTCITQIIPIGSHTLDQYNNIRVVKYSNTSDPICSPDFGYMVKLRRTVPINSRCVCIELPKKRKKKGGKKKK